ncbi:MAG: hypothetical protein O7D96_07120 [SAR324 cluster bacterium]|nr:hypothetical protein [SAR324 cluster bacterium]
MSAADVAGVMERIAGGSTLEGLTQLFQLEGSDPLTRLNQALYAPARDPDTPIVQEEIERLQSQLIGASGKERAVILYNLGCLALFMDEIADARMYFQESLNLAPGFLPSRHNLGYTAELLAEIAEAERLYGEVLEQSPEFILSRLSLALVKLNQGQRDAALAELHSLAERMPGDASIALYLSRALLTSGIVSDAAEVLTLLGDVPGWEQYPDLRECSAYASYLLHEIPEAEAEFRRLLDEDEGNQFARIGLMRILAERDAIVELIPHAEALDAAAPTDESSHLLGMLKQG